MKLFILWAVILGVVLAISGGQTRLFTNSQTQPASAPLTDGVGTHLAYAADAGQLNVIRPIRKIGSQDQTQPGDCHAFILATVPSDYSFALAQPNLVPGSYDNGCEIVFRNLGPGTLTLVSSGGNLIGGGSSKAIPPNSSCTIDSDGVGWQPENC